MAALASVSDCSVSGNGKTSRHYEAANDYANLSEDQLATEKGVIALGSDALCGQCSWRAATAAAARTCASTPSLSISSSKRIGNFTCRLRRVLRIKPDIENDRSPFPASRSRRCGGGCDQSWRIRDRPVSARSSWQNGYAERLIGSIRRECLDHVVVVGERHLRHVLASYQKYYNEVRTHHRCRRTRRFA
jgi:Integrase core domain